MESGFTPYPVHVLIGRLSVHQDFFWFFSLLFWSLALIVWWRLAGIGADLHLVARAALVVACGAGLAGRGLPVPEEQPLPDL